MNPRVTDQHRIHARNPARYTAAALMLALLLPAAVLLPVMPARALSSDADQPIEIEADFAELDEQAGRTIYRGRVEVQQGSMRMKGDVLEAEFDEDQNLTKVHLVGEPAWFSQTPDGSSQDVEGEALTIDYFRRENLVKLIKEAQVTRGEQRFEGDEIDYDTERSIVKARAATPAAAGPARPGTTPSGRVRVVIPPKKKEAP